MIPFETFEMGHFPVPLEAEGPRLQLKPVIAQSRRFTANLSGTLGPARVSGYYDLCLRHSTCRLTVSWPPPRPAIQSRGVTILDLEFLGAEYRRPDPMRAVFHLQATAMLDSNLVEFVIGFNSMLGPCIPFRGINPELRSPRQRATHGVDRAMELGMRLGLAGRNGGVVSAELLMLNCRPGGTYADLPPLIHEVVMEGEVVPGARQAGT